MSPRRVVGGSKRGYPWKTGQRFSREFYTQQKTVVPSIGYNLFPYFCHLDEQARFLHLVWAGRGK
jgi:hypothetical protein